MSYTVQVRKYHTNCRLACECFSHYYFFRVDSFLFTFSALVER